MDRHHSALERLAQRLCAEETVAGDEVLAILAAETAASGEEAPDGVVAPSVPAEMA